MDNRIHVVIGVIYNTVKDKVLISKRSGRQHLAGLWEFPGGKVETDEDVATALSRELYEELGISLKSAKRIKIIKHNYPDKKVLLDIWCVENWNGEAVGREGQNLRWVSIGELSEYSFPEANKYIVNLIRLHPIYLISRDYYDDVNFLISTVSECMKSGLRLFQLRLDSKKAYDLKRIIRELKKVSGRYRAGLILNGEANDIDRYDIDGIHLKAKKLFSYNSRPIPGDYIIGASCHNEEQLDQANKLDLDYIFISPVCKTDSHPDKNAIGWKRFSHLCRLTNTVVYALGGMGAVQLTAAKSCGAHGIAMINSIWGSDNPVESLNQCLLGDSLLSKMTGSDTL